MITIHAITTLRQGKLHRDYDALCREALAQRDALIRYTGLALLQRVLAGAKNLLNQRHAKVHAPYRNTSFFRSVRRT